MTVAVYDRRPRRGAAAGLALTLALHGAIAAGILVARRRPDTLLEIPRDFVVARLVKFGKPREKFWLPRLAQPQRSKAPPATLKLSDDVNAAPTPAEAPRPEDAEVSNTLRRALERARTLSQAADTDEPAVGLPTGVAEGTAATAAAGDEYASAVAAAIRKNWTVPAELVSEAELRRLEAEVRVTIAKDGALSEGQLARPSGNGLFDDACLQAIKSTGRVPAPPPVLRARAGRGFAIVFDGKDVGK